MLSLKHSSKHLITASAVTLILTACGGGQDNKPVSNAPPPATSAVPPAPANVDVQTFSGKRSDYSITKTGSSISVRDTRTGSITGVPASIKILQFSDFRVNLSIADKAASISTTSLNNLLDLYVAFFNRVPDADGLAYWIDRLNAGMSDIQIAESFYLVALESPALTGYSSTMSNDDFIRIIYKNVLGRSGITAPNPTEVNYWSSQLSKGIPKSSMIKAILVAAREYANDPTWGWVTKLLNNKLDVANYFAVQQGLSYLNLSDNISKTNAIANAVTSSSTADALSLIGVSDNGLVQGNYGDPLSLSGICTPSGEKDWVRAHLNDVYLWYKEIIDVPKANYSTPQTYFDALIVKSRDRFSFTSDQGGIDDYFQSGEDVGYGYSLTRNNGGIRVRYVQPGSPADLAQIKRGATLVSIDNTSVGSYLNDAQYNAAYPVKRETHQFQVLDYGAFTPRTVSMTATTVTTAPVLQNQVLNVNGKKIGYMVFTDHIRTAEAPLVDTITKFKQAGVSDLVLDLRYNGGGYLYIANELAAMIAGSKTYNKVFEQLQFNDKHADETADNVSYFYNTDTKSRPLPQLNLSRVFVLTGTGTCSASESIINGLKPFMDVILIGDTTCGKPYGFEQTNNCQTAYFAIMFAGVNSLGQGDYTNGFTPKCSVPDDLNHQLGDTSESRLSVALNFVNTGSCPASTFSPAPAPAPFDPVRDREPRPWRNIKILKANSTQFR